MSLTRSQHPEPSLSPALRTCTVRATVTTLRSLPCQTRWQPNLANHNSAVTSCGRFDTVSNQQTIRLAPLSPQVDHSANVWACQTSLSNQEMELHMGDVHTDDMNMLVFQHRRVGPSDTNTTSGKGKQTIATTKGPLDGFWALRRRVSGQNGYKKSALALQYRTSASRSIRATSKFR